MSIDLKALGFTQEELQQRVVDQICQQMLDAHFYDEDGEEGTRKNSSKFYRQLTAEITKKIDAAVSAIAEQHVLPNLTQYVENFIIQETNSYGEERGGPVTFTEYLVARANNYIAEVVDYEGVSQAEARAKGNSWYGSRNTQTRIVHLIEKHLHYTIETAMKEALTGANAQIVKGIEETCKLKLAEIASKFKVTVATK